MALFPEGDDWVDILVRAIGVTVGIAGMILILWFEIEIFGASRPN